MRAYVFSPDHTIGGEPSDSALWEVLYRLSFLNVELITVDDVPAILAFLSAPEAEADAAWQAWRAYGRALDQAERRAELRDDDYYCL